MVFCPLNFIYISQICTDEELTKWQYTKKYAPLRKVNLELESLSHVLSYSVIVELLTGSEDENNHKDFDTESFLLDNDAVTEIFGNLDKSSIKELLS